MTTKHVKKYLSEIGRKGGSKTSPKKRASCLRNAKISVRVRAERKQQKQQKEKP